MAITYTLKFVSFKTLDQVGQLSDVIKTVHYQLVATTEGSPGVEKGIAGRVHLPNPQSESFIPRASVTVSNVQAWFAAIEDEEVGNLLQHLKDSLSKAIAEQQDTSARLEIPNQSFRDGVSV